MTQELGGACQVQRKKVKIMYDLLLFAKRFVHITGTRGCIRLPEYAYYSRIMAVRLFVLFGANLVRRPGLLHE